MLGLAVVVTGCGASMPPPSPATFRTEAVALADRLQSLEWDFHIALRRDLVEEAKATATEAVRLIASFEQGPLREATGGCLEEARAAIGDLLGAELARWRAWSEGRNYPTEDEISLFIAFYGAEKPWILLLDQAEKLCHETT